MTILPAACTAAAAQNGFAVCVCAGKYFLLWGGAIGTAYLPPASLHHKNNEAFRSLVNIVDKCEELFQKLTPSETPYYIFVDEMEAYYGDVELLKRDLTLIRDMLFTIHRINSYGKVHIIAAIRNEIIFAMDISMLAILLTLQY